LRDFQSVTPNERVTDTNGPFSALQADCDGVTAPDPLPSEDEREAAVLAAVDRAIADGTLEEVPPEEWERAAIAMDFSQNGGAA
jgi:hypothetical protein